jgi:hypothetical protein
MMRHLLVAVVAGAALAGLGGTHPALAQKQGGILKVYHRDSPASMCRSLLWCSGPVRLRDALSRHRR